MVSGTARFTVRDTSYGAPAGSLVMVPPGAPHTFANPGGEPAVILNTCADHTDRGAIAGARLGAAAAAPGPGNRWLAEARPRRAADMNTAIVIALIALAGSIISTSVTVFGVSALQTRKDARKVLDLYSEPLLSAAYELQARLYNILQLRFVETYITAARADKRAVAIDSTLYVFAQFLGWREIIRREVQYLRFSRYRRTRETGRLLAEIDDAFLSSDFGPQFMIWRVEQRGVGERMITTVNGKACCLGYASFVERFRVSQKWLQSLEEDLEKLDDQGRVRLARLQHLLLDLMWQLDGKRQRYPLTDLKKA